MYADIAELTSMFKMMILLRKKVSLSDNEFSKYCLETHGPLAQSLPGLRRYVVNLVKRPQNREPDYNAVTELWFDDVTAMKKAFASPEGAATQKDMEAFASSFSTMYVDEHIMV